MHSHQNYTVLYDHNILSTPCATLFIYKFFLHKLVNHSYDIHMNAFIMYLT